MNHSTAVSTQLVNQSSDSASADRHTGGGAPWSVPTGSMAARHLTPGTNRGVVNTTRLTTSLHWLAATTQHVDTMTCVGFISDVLGYGPEVRPTGLSGYTATFKWFGGIRILDNEQRPDMGVMLLADGDTCDHHGFDQLAYIYQALQMTATRLDLAADHCRFTPSALRRLWLADRVSTVCKPMRDALSPRKAHRTHSWRSSPTGDTFYMGSRESTQFARCYNSRGFTRFEMELKQERAAQTMTALCEGSPLSSTLGAAIAQFVKFVDLDDTNRSRCTVLPFWQNLLDTLNDSGAVTRLDPRPDPTPESLIQYIEHQVAPSLAVYEIIMGKQDNYDDIRRDLRRKGLDRCKPKHHALISQAGGWLSSVNPELYNPLPQLPHHA